MPNEAALFHVTFTRNVPAIRKHGIRTFRTTNWVRAGDRARYGSGEIYAFEHEHDAQRWAGKMDWDHHHETGSGKISIIAFRSIPSQWETDVADPLSQLGSAGKWLKSKHPVGPEQGGYRLQVYSGGTTRRWSRRFGFLGGGGGRMMPASVNTSRTILRTRSLTWTVLMSRAIRSIG